jgi:threonine dehydratase
MEDLITIDEIRNAQARIAARVPASPVMPSVYFSQISGLNVILKLENLNVSGSFKIRGATNALLQEKAESLTKGVVAASAGNHAQGVANVCKFLGVNATIFMPERTPLIKIESTKYLGAKVICVGQVFDEAFQAAKTFAEERGAVFIHPYADPRVIHGQGTVGLELLDQVKSMDAVLVPIGGGGLISGLACAIKTLSPSTKVYGIQTEAFPAMFHAFKGTEYQKTGRAVTISDGIAVKGISPLNLACIKKYVDDILLVDEEETATAVVELVERNHLLTEGAGAVPIAAVLRYHNFFKNQGLTNIVCVISGGNIDSNLLSRITDRALVQTGRLSRIKFIVQDRPGALASLLKVISSVGANLQEVYHDRTFATSHYSDVEVEAVIETSNHVHRTELLGVLKEQKIDFQIL